MNSLINVNPLFQIVFKFIDINVISKKVVE